MSKRKDRVTRLADAAFKQAMIEEIRIAKQTGTPVITWKDGRVQAVSPEEAEREMNRKKRTGR